MKFLVGLLTIVGFLFFCVGVASSQYVEYDILELRGDYYPVISSRTADLIYGGALARIDSVRITVIGYGGGTNCPGLIGLYIDSFLQKNGDLFAGSEMCWYRVPHRDFVCERWYTESDFIFVSGSPQHITQGDTLTLRIKTIPDSPLCPDPPQPRATIYEVRLSLKLDYNVPTDKQTWGRIKMIYESK